ncbi:16S rRNA (guanine(966)-N(2))-methyltransferase RsmD [Alteribacter natronophilus]|uniref:16S rRNA (guanine(966)-N(2))-methyltransferase RsmD n=1 Tax=Alteribacter natronophilus TaxID=2583810 RepID=UPI00110D6E99|nr:16S rRNA (guanine(966)-N(2))-methyltransferase RsmD [Alteribacter natronophilus]TMW73104.1 16S rRNA (guanine(966)-N(2))-methyltransferase RsmD [Alteribacter natronophilus]
MRVISGRKKGTLLKAVPGMNTRPTTDKVKESIFNMIGPYFQGGEALDLYGGAGGLGIEALSRGVEKAVFVDRDFKAVKTIRNNLKAAAMENQAEVYRNEAGRALQALVKRKKSFSLIFLDPPYAKQQLKEDLTFIGENALLEESGRIVAEHDAKVNLDNRYGMLELVRRETYGDTAVSIYRLNETEESD